MTKTKPSTVDEYINAAPPDAQEMLREIRSLLKKVVPNAIEMIKWGYPVLFEKRILFSYSAFKNHINFMPTGPAIKPFEKELSIYKTGKDTIQIPYDRPLASSLIRKIAEYRVKDVRENDAKWMY
ncbi:MAG: DUF1801 domain-containing protein [Bacteroidales bacterium]|nr:DUF1801 domain-containing protein [Bacteroidales bacterium]